MEGVLAAPGALDRIFEVRLELFAFVLLFGIAPLEVGALLFGQRVLAEVRFERLLAHQRRVEVLKLDEDVECDVILADLRQRPDWQILGVEARPERQEYAGEGRQVFLVWGRGRGHTGGRLVRVLLWAGVL